MLHGHSASRHHALVLANTLRIYTRWVVVYDQRGHGDADHHACTLGLKEPADAVGVIQQVTSPGERVLLAGYSMGSRVALRAAPHPDLQPVLAGLLLEAFYRDWGQPVAGMMRDYPLPVPLLMPVLRAIRWLTTIGQRHFDRAHETDGVHVPTLLFHGDRDDLCPLSGAQSIANELHDAKLVMIPGGDHADLNLTDPARYHEALQRLLQRMQTQPIPPTASNLS